MRVVAAQENLRKALSTVAHAVAQKGPLPILANVLLEAEDGQLRLAATNLDQAIETRIGCRVEEGGRVTVPAKLLADFVASLPAEPVTLQLEPRTFSLEVVCNRFQAKLRGLDPEDFPALPQVDGEPLATLPADLFARAVASVAVAAGTDDARPALTGLLFVFEGETLAMAAADGFRLAERRVALPAAVSEPQQLLIPARPLAEAVRICLDAGEEVEIYALEGRQQVALRADGLLFVTRLIQAQFPDYQRIIPEGYTTRVVAETEALRKAVKVTALFAQDRSGTVLLRVEGGGELTPGQLHVSASSQEVGGGATSLDVTVQGEEGEIAFNARFLSDALAAIETPQVALEFTTPTAPGVFRPVGEEGYLHIVMPISLR